MTTFHPFPRLPLELREHIWKDTMEPRTVDVRRVREWPQRYGQLISSTPIPAILQSCREARNLGIYKRVFFEVDATSKWKGIHTPETAAERFLSPDEPEEEAPVSEQRYVWLDFDIDMVDIGTSKFGYYKSIVSVVKRLKFERKNGDEWFYRTEAQELRKFVTVEEIHVVCADGFWMWGDALYEHPWPCAEEKIVFIDAFDGRVAHGMELETICRQMLKDARLEATGEAYSSDEES
jgi:hypothetical protein